MPLPIDPGAIVEVRGERWLLTAVAVHGACSVLTLEGRDRANAKQRLSVIEPFERSKPLATTLQRRPRRAVLRSALGAIADARSPDTLWTAAAAAIDVWPYQLEPALAAVRGATRLLLADAVGLGKTIQAGLLLAELLERGWIERALIVCPAGLRDTWARELDTRFGIGASVIDHVSIAEGIASLPPGTNPWSGHRLAIASIDFIKRPEVLAAIEAEPLDLLIADEAHHLTPGTDRGAAISRLALRATWCVLMSATPHSGDATAFKYLAGIGDHGDALTIFRRSRSDVGITSARRSHVLPVTPTPAEAALFEAVDRYARQMWRERGHDDQVVRLIAVTLLRRAASSATAILRTLMRRRDLLDTTAPLPIQPRLPWDEEDETDGVEADAMLASPGLQSLAEEQAILARLMELACLCDAGSKLRRLARLIDRIGEPVVVFTEYRDTLEAIVSHLRDARRVATIHGGMPADLRRSSVDAFNEGRIDVFVATDAAGEGLNLHHRSRVVIDVELPWNPLRLEQRVGRVDRLGQQRTVHAIRLFHPGTIEQQVLRQLTLRSHRAAEAFDRHGVTETNIADAILGGRTIEITAPTTLVCSRITEATAEARRIESQRYAHRLGARSSDGAVWCRPRRRARSTSMVLISRRSTANELGAITGETIEASRLRLPPQRCDRSWRESIEAAWEKSTQESSGSSVPAVAEPIRRQIGRRIHHIREHLARARIEYQGSLFDRRDEDDRLTRDRAMARLNGALLRTEAAIGSPSHRGRVVLIAAWPEIPR